MFSNMVEAELGRARRLHPQRQISPHESLAIIWEEFEELKAEVWKKHFDRRAALEELVQIGAMCQRAAEDLGLC